jgi:hypothetical protein
MSTQDDEIPRLSTGQLSTLAIWRLNLSELPGDHGRALAYLDRKIAQQGPDEPVVTDERQVLAILLAMDGAPQLDGLPSR